jgi:uncharacterized repeat protein (TIGR01451 family)/fimbrial isopeptide formation D2 family protein
VTQAQLRGLCARALRAAALLCVLTCLAAPARAQVCVGNPGRDGPGGTLSGVVNTYYPGVGTANAGTTGLQLGTPRGAATAVAVGDLLLVIQMQDATINTSNNNAYGANNGTGRGATALGSSGRFEYVVVTALVAGGVTVRGTGAGNGLLNTYTTAAAGGSGQKRFQVIRVPQYSSATLGSTLTASTWNGATGGVLAVDVAGVLGLGSATVSVTGLGFRGGGGRAVAGSGGTADTDYRNTAARAAHGMKGEGIAGTPRYVYDPSTASVLDTAVDGYPNGSSARGAPGNAGGGGTDGNPGTNDENSGGGGGANGGDGGVGGNTWNSQEVAGGLGGDAITYTTATPQALLGGGGGAGSRNNSADVAASGGAGGGIVMLRAASISGGGTINANGADAYNDTENDGGGGGGAGGSVWVSVTTGSLAGLNVNARGGRGGDAWRDEPANGTPGARHGPGGGGGGGLVAHTGGATVNVTGGDNGETTTSFSAYGSTDGATGQTLAITTTQVPGVSSGAQCVPLLTVTKTTSTASVTNGPSGTTAAYSILVSNAANRSAATQLSVSDTLPAGFTYASTASVALAGGATRPSTTNPTAGAAVPAWSQFTIPGGASVTVNFTVAVAAGTNGVKQNPAAATYLDPGRTTTAGTATANYNSASSTGEDVNVVGPPNVTLVKDCTAPANCTTQHQLPGTELTYRIAFTNEGGRAAQSFVLTDQIPANTDFKLGSVTTALGTTGLTVAVVYSNNGGTTYLYTPVSGGGGATAGYDRAVTHVRWVFTNNLSQTAPNNTGSVSFVTRIR